MRRVRTLHHDALEKIADERAIRGAKVLVKRERNGLGCTLDVLRVGNPNLRISESAFDVGFQSLSQFNHTFRKVAGQSPRDYRAKPALADA